MRPHPDDPRRRARDHQEGEAERPRQRPLQPPHECGADTRCKTFDCPLVCAARPRRRQGTRRTRV
eukprot:449520-Prymnesium_polylepis.2